MAATNEEWHGPPLARCRLVARNGAEVWANDGHDLSCVYGAALNRYGHGSTIVPGPGDDTVIIYD